MKYIPIYLESIAAWLHFDFACDILVFTVLDGEVAVPCNSQSAIARLNSC